MAVGTFVRWRLRALTGLLDRLLPRRKPASSPKRILCLISGGLGDRLMVLPALRHLRERFAGSHVCVVWMEGRLPVVDVEFDETLEYGKQRWFLALRAATRNWDLVFANVQGVFSVFSELCAVVSRCPTRIGPFFPGTASHRTVYTQPYEYRLNEHVTLTNARAAGDVDVNKPLRYPVTLKEKIPDSSVVRIGIHAGAGRDYDLKRWPTERFRALAEKLCEADGVEVAVIAGPTEESEAEAITRGLAARICATPTIEALFEEISRCRAFVANDSGPAHVAASLGVPVVVVFGPTNPRRVVPVFAKGTVIQCDLPCIPCFDSAGGCRMNHECMDNITVERVAQACRTIVPQISV